MPVKKSSIYDTLPKFFGNKSALQHAKAEQRSQVQQRATLLRLTELLKQQERNKLSLSDVQGFISLGSWRDIVVVINV